MLGTNMSLDTEDKEKENTPRVPAEMDLLTPPVKIEEAR